MVWNYLIKKDHTMINKFNTILLFSFYLLFSTNTYAQKLDRAFGDWSVLTSIVDLKKICYIASLPVKQEGSVQDNANAYFLISLFPERSPEVSYSPGFDIKVDSSIKLDIDGLELFLTKISGQVVWAENSDQDNRVALELKKGIKLKILAPDNKGSYALDTFSLKGFTASYNHMLTLCKE